MAQIAAGHGVQKLNKTAMSLGAARSYPICFELSNQRATPPHACNKMSLRTPVPSFFANGRGSEHSPSMGFLTTSFTHHTYTNLLSTPPIQKPSKQLAMESISIAWCVNVASSFSTTFHLLLTSPQTNYSWHLDSHRVAVGVGQQHGYQKYRATAIRIEAVKFEGSRGMLPKKIFGIQRL